MNVKRAIAGIGVTAALVLTTGCGKAADKIAERAVEEGIERGAGGGDVDISEDGVSFKSPDGQSVQVDAEGNMIIEGADGQVLASGDRAEVPDGWPAFLALPDDAALLTSQSSTSDGVKMGIVAAEVDGDAKVLYEGYKEALEDAGFEVTSDSFTQSSDGDWASLSGEKGDDQVSITIGSVGATDEGKVHLNLSVTGL